MSNIWTDKWTKLFIAELFFIEKTGTNPDAYHKNSWLNKHPHNSEWKVKRNTFYILPLDDYLDLDIKKINLYFTH